jgi:hypothetical protein
MDLRGTAITKTALGEKISEDAKGMDYSLDFREAYAIQSAVDSWKGFSERLQQPSPTVFDWVTVISWWHEIYKYMFAGNQFGLMLTGRDDNASPVPHMYMYSRALKGDTPVLLAFVPPDDLQYMTPTSGSEWIDTKDLSQFDLLKDRTMESLAVEYAQVIAQNRMSQPGGPTPDRLQPAAATAREISELEDALFYTENLTPDALRSFVDTHTNSAVETNDIIERAALLLQLNPSQSSEWGN